MGKTPIILYVEDEPRSRRVMQMVTEDMGLTDVIIFEDSTDFMTRVCSLDPSPDVIFLDIHMTPHTGFEMLAMLRGAAQFANIPIVAMTASVMNEEIHRLKSVGFDGCIAKPIDFDTFPETLQRIINGEKIWRIIS